MVKAGDFSGRGDSGLRGDRGVMCCFRTEGCEGLVVVETVRWRVRGRGIVDVLPVGLEHAVDEELLRFALWILVSLCERLGD
jgi:hypothetical protein